MTDKRLGKQDTIVETGLTGSVKRAVSNEKLIPLTEAAQTQETMQLDQESSDSQQQPVITRKFEQALTPVLTRATGVERLQSVDSVQIHTTDIRMPDAANSYSRMTPVMNSVEAFMLPETLSIRQPGWDRSLGNNILWMIKEDLQSASIRVKPAELGPLNIQVSVQQDQLNINISAHQGVAREALEAALPRLREQFAAQGFQQVNVDISQHQERSSADARANPDSSSGHSDWAGVEQHNPPEEQITTQQSQTYRAHDGLLDAFA